MVTLETRRQPRANTCPRCHKPIDDSQGLCLACASKELAARQHERQEMPRPHRSSRAGAGCSVAMVAATLAIILAVYFILGSIGYALVERYDLWPW